MMTIGQFAQVTGLTPKALRLYDECGLLAPAEVTPGNGYRRYAASQVRTAVVIRLLRATGMPIDEVRAAIHEPDRLEELRATFATAVTAARARQDTAMAVADRLLSRYEQLPQVRTRTMPEQYWAGIVLPDQPVGGPAPDAAPDTCPEGEDVEVTNAAFASLHRALAEAGLMPDGPWWTTLRPGPDDQVSIRLCWPVPGPLPARFSMPRLRVDRGRLPRRTEAYVRCPQEQLDLPGPDAVTGTPLPDPAYAALLAFQEEHRLDDAEVRQVGVLAEDGEPVAIDLTVTMP